MTPFYDGFEPSQELLITKGEATMGTGKHIKETLFC
jgi:hypothetical protein